MATHGYYVDEDDGKYWYFGQMTSNAVQYFQAGVFLPETGIVDPNTWKALLEEGEFEQGPEVLEKYSGGEYAEDLSEDLNEDRVWLMGEERWSYVDATQSQTHRKVGRPYQAP
uniref:Peptidoglycan binding-like domain-containing protein n=1 Tax=Pyramimonas obovata TaxID=1411642 RepID=A0A7S0WJM0_9CHLO